MNMDNTRENIYILSLDNTEMAQDPQKRVMN